MGDAFRHRQGRQGGDVGAWRGPHPRLPAGENVINGLRDKGIRVPEDVAVIGFDDSEDAAYTSPTLTTIEAGREEIADRSVELLPRRIEARLGGGETPASATRVDAAFQLIERESTLGK